MTSQAQTHRIIGTLRAEDGKGVVRMEDRFATDAEDLWSALTDPNRLTRWLGEIEGDLRLGGTFHARFADGFEGDGRIEVCEPPQRVLARMESGTIEVILNADDGETVLVWEERGMPLEHLADYGAGIQIHVEELAAYIAGRDRCEIRARYLELVPAYRELAANVG